MADVQHVPVQVASRGDHSLCAALAVATAAFVMLHCLAVMFDLA